MNRQAIFTVGMLLGFFAFGSLANAETVQAKRSAKVYAEQGEQSQPVTKVDAGTNMMVLRKEGRWYKVRANGRTGWITRTNLKLSVEESKATDSRKSGFVEGRKSTSSNAVAPKDRVGADATKDKGPTFLDEPKESKPEPRTVKPPPRVVEVKPVPVPVRRVETPVREERRARERDPDRVEVIASATDLFARPSETSKLTEEVRRGDLLKVVRKRRGWYRVENRSGSKKGWIHSDDVRIAGGGEVAPARAVAREERPTERIEREGPASGGQGAYEYENRLNAGANLGFMTTSQTFSSSSAAPLGNYSIAANSLTVSLRGDYTYVKSEKMLLGIDSTLLLSRAAPGIVFENDGMRDSISFHNVIVDVEGKVGYNLGISNGMAIYGRAGVYFRQMKVERSNGTPEEVNSARLPSELLVGPKIGVSVESPRLYHRGPLSKVSGRLQANLMMPLLFATRMQTSGLEDGARSDASALFVGLDGGYNLGGDFQLTAGYQFYQAVTNWDGLAEESKRGHDAMDATRRDKSHMVLVGLGRDF